MLKAGAIILSIGTGFQCIVSVLSLVFSFISSYAPILKMVLTDKQISNLDKKVMSATKSLAILHNSGAVLGTIIILIIIWTSLINGHKWAYWTLLFAGIWGHSTWFVSDRFIGNETLIVNIVFTLIFITGISLAGFGIFTS